MNAAVFAAHQEDKDGAIAKAAQIRKASIADLYYLFNV